MPLLVEAVSVEFSGLKALDTVSLALHSGEIVGLIGPNGSGKSTLVNAITGQVRLAGGHIRLGDKHLSGLSPRQIALAGISRTFQTVRLFAQMTVLENIETAALAQGAGLAEARSLAHSLLADFALADKAEELANTLNYGDQRRVEIARALAARPKFLLLDEPAAGMNDAESETLRQLLAELPAQYQLGLLIIDHDMGLMMRLCPRLHVLAFGRTLTEGNAEQVRHHPAVIEAYLGQDHA
ncbi:ABC transporter ATP-binding protein [Ventosimonas gracilis]|uniref:ABC transporter ATP-binding protein n=1 Tax=Ventosimonas gracilis TaxID=1680762 RepID=A0A139SWA0_9GAMM|nr:ABC transporter ATP-binding protein [Ventosimonas gracilis]KXU38774.1 ABC transporter ATP-binding protein [Ventosimonas gracilis]